jgi:hypothetical protein
MAAGSLAAPGTTYGPCAEPCEHRDCALTRTSAATPCVYEQCGEPIGYDRLFFQTDVGLAHADCVYDEMGG